MRKWSDHVHYSGKQLGHVWRPESARGAAALKTELSFVTRPRDQTSKHCSLLPRRWNLFKGTISFISVLLAFPWSLSNSCYTFFLLLLPPMVLIFNQSVLPLNPAFRAGSSGREHRFRYRVSEILQSLRSKRTFEQQFRISEEIASGSTSTVYLAVEKWTHAKFVSGKFTCTASLKNL